MCWQHLSIEMEELSLLFLLLTVSDMMSQLGRHHPTLEEALIKSQSCSAHADSSQDSDPVRKKFSKSFPENWAAVQEFVKSTTSAIENKTFCPLKYTDPRGCRRFTLLPVYSYLCRHITIDFQALEKLLSSANIAHEKAVPTASEASQIYFDLSKMKDIGYQTLDSLETEKSVF
ncbi:hypothetical protein EC973_001986 [Apophysomyces ossiformis]|uniref:Uncharacterized protein n=1 Tax=Apophysomyces ossiformis TaxID=679940 RepID=A0A8H7BJ04_9FUNG|nr:hypothetical protein EC973_001986 [Apophysomyces ossiformis]